MSASTFTRPLRVAALLLVAAGGVTYGFRTYNGTVWPGATADYRISTASFPLGSDQLREAEQSFEAWNQISGSEFLFTYTSSGSSGALDHNDGINGVAFSSQVQGSTLGVTFTSDSRGVRRSADVLFNNRTNWSFDGSPTRSEFDFGSTCRHEYGHALGLKHSDRGCAALMGGGCGRNGVVRPFAADDLAGIRFLYPGTSRTNPGPSTPAATAAEDWELSALTVSARSVSPGDDVQVGYTVSQRGGASPTQAPPRAYVLSTNQTLSTQDTILLQTQARQGPFASGASFQGQSAVTIPAGTAPGTYWIGVLVDPNGQVNEQNEQNNARAQQLEVLGAGGVPAAPAGQVDWTIARLDVTPAHAQPGERVDVTFELINRGGASASESPVVTVFSSSNQTITTRDQELRAEAARQGPFATGTGYTLTFSLTIPATSQPGPIFLGVFADPSDRVAESDEANNTAAQPFEVLAPTAPASAPGAAPASSPVASASPSASPSAGTTAAGASAASQTASNTSGGGSGGGGGCSLGRNAPGGAPWGALCALLLLLGAARLR